MKNSKINKDGDGEDGFLAKEFSLRYLINCFFAINCNHKVRVVAFLFLNIKTQFDQYFLYEIFYTLKQLIYNYITTKA
jgi:hypothetical protein